MKLDILRLLKLDFWNSRLDNYDEKYVKIKFNSDNDLTLGLGWFNSKTLGLHNMAIVVRSVFDEDSKCYTQVFLNECLHKL